MSSSDRPSKKELTDAQIFDISGVETKWGISKSGREITCIFREKSSARMNMMKLYLLLKQEMEKLEAEIGVMGESTSCGDH